MEIMCCTRYTRDGYEKARARTLPIGNEEIFDGGSSGSTIEARPYGSSVPHAAAGWLTWAQLTAHLASPIFVFTCHEAIIRIDWRYAPPWIG